MNKKQGACQTRVYYKLVFIINLSNTSTVFYSEINNMLIKLEGEQSAFLC